MSKNGQPHLWPRAPETGFMTGQVEFQTARLVASAQANQSISRSHGEAAKVRAQRRDARQRERKNSRHSGQDGEDAA